MIQDSEKIDGGWRERGDGVEGGLLCGRQAKANSRYCLNKLNKTKSRNVTRSLHSIEINRNSFNVANRGKQAIKRTLVISESQSRVLHTSRKWIDEQLSRKNMFQKILKLNHRSQKIRSIDGGLLQEKQKKIKNCIQLMQGVLEEIQNQKSSRKLFKSIKHIPEEREPEKKCDNQNANGKQSKSKFQEYIHNVCKMRDNSKVMLVRRAKTKSTILYQDQIKSSIVVNPKRFQTINGQKPREIRLLQCDSNKKGVPTVQIIVQNKQEKQKNINVLSAHNSCAKNEQLKVNSVNKKDEQTRKGIFQQIDYSVIDKVNQSSFISDNGKKLLIDQFKEENINQNMGIVIQQQGKGKQTIDVNHRKILKIKNNKKFKNLFPNGFF